ncbi:MAG: hypothetical protein GY863_14970, partial [bacterium]|nr:hypothetical protein [bacterium]
HAFSPDGKYIAYVSDESLEEEIWLYEMESGDKRKLTSHESQKTGMIWAPDSKKMAYNAANTLFTYDIENNRNTRIAYNQARGYRPTDISKQGRWLVYYRSDDDQNNDVYMYDTEENREYNITQNPFSDVGGSLTHDGKKAVFLSTRDNGIAQLFYVPLNRVTEDPDDPLVKEKKAKEKKNKDEEEEYAVTVDPEDIDRRAVQITDGDNRVGSYFLSADGETVYYTSSDDKGPGLFSIGMNGKDKKKITDGVFSRLVPAYDKKTVFYTRESKVFKMKLSNKKKEQVKFDFTVKVDKKAEWRQIFEESWRVMKYRFYDENMHGFDWDAIKREYLPILDYVGEYNDLYDLTNEMIGELNASHTGVSGASGVDLPPTYRTRFPGFEMAPEDGSYRVTHIYRDGPADKEWIDLDVGDVVVSVDGREVSEGDNYWKNFNEFLNEYCTVTVESQEKGRRDIRIKTVNSLRNIKYDEWVAGNREFVEKESDGKIAYVHIRSMNRTSLRKFENEINQFWNAKGIIVDIRYNGGGNTDQQILDILERRPYEYWNFRWGSRTWGRRPRQAIAGPKVMLINSRSASDSEVTPLGFRDLGLGTIVGSPTMGAVIATGSYRLIHGGRIRTPGSL